MCDMTAAVATAEGVPPHVVRYAIAAAGRLTSARSRARHSRGCSAPDAVQAVSNGMGRVTPGSTGATARVKA